MEGLVWVIIGVFLLALFAVLGAWQRSIDAAAEARALAEIEEARERGTSRALAQHPQIDRSLCIGCASCIKACPEEGVIGIVNGVAHVIHGSRCIGHGRCADACPVAALTVGLGDLSSRSDIPVLSESLETSVRGVFIAGELGGFALIRNAIEQGVTAAQSIAARVPAARRRPAPEGTIDLLIVGAGPAGLAASLEATSRKLEYLTISQDDLGGTVRQYPRRKLTMTQPVTLPLYGRMKRYEYRKEELIEMWDGIRKQFDLRVESGVRFLSASKRGGVFESETSKGVIRSRFILLALGRRGTPRKLGVPGEESEKVFYRLIDAATYRGEHLLVVGGGDSAIEAATALANQPGNVVTLSYRKAGFFRLKPRNETRIREYGEGGRVRVLFSSDVREIKPQSVVLQLRGDEPVDGERACDGARLLEIPNSHVFIFAGGVPPFPLLHDIGIAFGGEEKPVEAAPPAGKPEKEAVLS